MEAAILIVDDDPDTLDMLADFFRRCPYEIRKAPDALAALSKLDDRVKLIITDEEMPCISGSDFRNMVKTKYPNLPVIGITGLRSIDHNDFKNHFDDALFKPFRLASLRATVARFLLFFREGRREEAKAR